jgi:uncharacterized phiE125 gp8 family phage protein
VAAVCTTPPGVLAVSLDDAREKVRATADDGLDGQLTLSLQGLIAETEHAVGHCFMEQGWTVTFDEFPRACGADEPIIRLPHPVLAVQSVKYFDQAGVERTLAGMAYEIVQERYRTFLAPAPGTSWPSTMSRKRAVTIQCTAGYGSDPSKTPAPARQYILARLELEFCPPLRAPTLEQLEGALAPLKVYG